MTHKVFSDEFPIAYTSVTRPLNSIPRQGRLFQERDSPLELGIYERTSRLSKMGCDATGY